MFAYIPCAAIMLGYGLCHLMAENLKELMDDAGRFKDVPEEIFNAFNGKYLKVSIGKGLITEEQIGALIERYAEFF